MTQEEKDILLKELCARLPYGIICTGKYIEYDDNDNPIFTDTTGELTQVHFTKNCCYLNVGLMNECEIETVKPYLRPMSSISSLISAKKWTSLWGIELIDWYNANHIDYQGLIEKGLALEAPEGMYNLN